MTPRSVTSAVTSRAGVTSKPGLQTALPGATTSTSCPRAWSRATPRRKAGLSRWALDGEAKDFSKTEAIEAWVHAALDRVIAERFGEGE